MNILQQTRLDLIKRAREAIKKDGYFKISTCDTWSYGWNPNEHLAMKDLQRNGEPDLHVEGTILHGVNDWVITLKAGAQKHFTIDQVKEIAWLAFRDFFELKDKPKGKFHRRELDQLIDKIIKEGKAE